jgi:hypothetical protein
MALAKFGDILVSVGADDVLGDLKKSIKLSDKAVDGKYHGSTWTVNDYGKQKCEIGGDANVVWAGSGSGGAGLNYAWLRYLMVSKLTQVFVYTQAITPLVTLFGDMMVDDIEESADDPDFETFKYGLLNAGEMEYA